MQHFIPFSYILTSLVCSNKVALQSKVPGDLRVELFVKVKIERSSLECMELLKDLWNFTKPIKNALSRLFSYISDPIEALTEKIGCVQINSSVMSYQS